MMEVDFEELGKLLYPKEPPENDEFQNYIIHLASCGVEKLSREVSHLKEERSLILEETQDLVYKNYKTFIHTADCSKNIFREFTNVEEHLESIIGGLPTLKESVEEFLTTSRDLSQSRHTTSLTLSKHPQLLEILELPQLMDTCVRNCYYDDALEILAYVKRLEKKHSDVPLIGSIVAEVKGGTRLMLLQLLLQLRSSLTLPQCLKTVGLLRRLEVFSESELKIKFLQARDSWFSGLIKAIPKEDAFQHITKVVETSRVHLFDIVTQYRAIFSDEEARFPAGEADINEQAIFHGWIVHKVNQFVEALEKDLAKGVGGNLESVVDQCMFFGQSFSRIGADFRGLLIPIFQEAALHKFQTDVRAANFKFDESLSSFSFMDSTQLGSSALLAEGQDKASPPLTLMEFAPLAHYANGLVTAFNGLRQCCPLALLNDVLRVISSSVAKVVSALVDLHHMEASGFTASEKNSFERMCFLLDSALLAHLNTCLQFLFPLQNVADVSGVPLSKLQKRNVGQLDVKTLMAPLGHFLPQKSVPEPVVLSALQQDENTRDNSQDKKDANVHQSLEIERESLDVEDPSNARGNWIESSGVRGNVVGVSSTQGNMVESSKARESMVESSNGRDNRVESSEVRDNRVESSEVRESLVESSKLRDNKVESPAVQENTVESPSIPESTIESSIVRGSRVDPSVESSSVLERVESSTAPGSAASASSPESQKCPETPPYSSQDS